MTRLIVLVGFILAFCAGAMVDHVVRGPGAPPNRPQGGGPAGYLASQLNLTADQQKKMKDIWSNTFQHGGRGQGGPGGGGPNGGGPGNRGDQHGDQRGDQRSDQRGDLRRQQEQAIAALIHADDKPAYDKIIADTRAKLDAIDADNKKAFETAVAQTKLILTPDQLKKYEQIVQRPWEHHDHDRPASRPSDH